MIVEFDNIRAEIKDVEVANKIKKLILNKKRTGAAPRNFKPWSSEETDLLKKMIANNTPASEIATSLGRTVNAVNMRMHFLGQPAREKQLISI